MNFQQKGGLSLGGGGLQLGGQLQQQQHGLGTGGLKLGMPTAAVAPQPAASATSGLQLSSGQTGGLSGQTRGIQLGSGQVGVLQRSSGQAGGLPLGSGQAGGLQLGSGQVGGLPLGSGQAGGLQLGSGQVGGLPLGSGQAGGGVKLGQANQQKNLQLGGGIQLGTTPQTSGGLQLGTTLQMGGGLQLGAAQSGGGGLQLGAAQQTGGGLQLGGATAQAKGLQLGGIGTTAAATQSKGLQLGGGGGGLQLGVGTVATSQSKGLNIGGATGLQTTTLGLGAQSRATQLGGLTTATTLGDLGVGGGGLGLKTGLPGGLGTSISVGQTASTAPSSTFRGLGGVDPNAGRTGTGDGSSTAVMDQALPPVLNTLVHQFSAHMKQESATGEEMDKFTDSDMKKVQLETSTHREVVGELLAQVQRDAQRVSYLKAENTEELRHVEIAQRTQELPAALQHENTAPAQYFQCVVSVFEEKMELYRNQLIELESHLSAVSRDHSMSPQNLVDILQVQYKPFLLLAAQLQTIHEQVQILREQYLAYRRVFLQDSTDVFEERRRKREAETQRAKVKTGPPPFSAAMGQATTALAAFSTGPGLAAGGVGGGGLGVGGGIRGVGLGGGIGGLTGLGGGIGGGLGAGGLSHQSKGLMLGGGLGMAASQPSLTGAGTAQPFQLQRPPLGKKRGTVTT